MKIEVLPIYKDYLYTDKRYAVMRGTAGSGKSVVAAQKHIIRCLKDDGHRILVIRRYYRTLRESVFKEMLKILENIDNSLYEYTVSPMKIKFWNGNEIIFQGLDDPEKIKSITGISSIWIEEATEISKQRFEQLNLRLRDKSKNYKQITLTFNPVSTANWVYKYFYENPSSEIIKNSFYSLTTYKDNHHIRDTYEPVMKEMKITNPLYYKIYALGEWGQKEDVIFKAFETYQNYLKTEESEETIYGIDFGYANDPTVILEIKKNKGKYYVDELIYQTKLTNSDLIQKLKTFNIIKNAPMYADSAEPARIEDIKRAGFNIHPAKKDVKNGIDYIQSINSQIISHIDNVNLNEEVLVYCWLKDKDGNLLDKPNKSNDHAIDALRYALYSHNRSNRNSTPRIVI